MFSILFCLISSKCSVFWYIVGIKHMFKYLNLQNIFLLIYSYIPEMYFRNIVM